jgi:lysophospholipase L1-like esterase
MMGLKRLVLIVLGSLMMTSLQAQRLGEYPFELSYYNFIQYDSNKLDVFGEDFYFERLYKRMDQMLTTGEGTIQIVQIGGSHIQADQFSGQLRTRFQTFCGDHNAGRGFVFPYRLARTNTPYGYYFAYEGTWETCRNVERKKTCDMGIGGIQAKTTDSISALTLLLEPENDLDYSFNAFKVYHNVDSTSFEIKIDSSIISSIEAVPEKGYTQIILNQYIDSLYVEFVKMDSIQTDFTLYGFLLENNQPGFVFHNLGINGASVPSFLRCNLLEEQLRVIRPDLVILGLGINDAYGKNFSQEFYEANYDTLVKRIRWAAPNASIIFTTNNDSYLWKRYANTNGELVQESMYRLAKKHDAAVWDMYEVMGGFNSITLWQRNGLAKRDKIHFTRRGYLLAGDLLFDAIIKSYGDYLQYDKVIINNATTEPKENVN